MDKIDVSPPLGSGRSVFFARAAGTKFTALVDGGNTTIDLYDEIGYWGVDAKTFRSRLKDAAGDITLRINSGGGDVFDGISIYNDLIAYEGKVRVEVTGIAASIASIIAMAGSEIVMAPGAFMMIHNSWTAAVGNRHDLAEFVSTLTKIDDVLAHIYTGRTKSGIRTVRQMMNDETWLTAKEAVDAGFATSIADGAQSSGPSAKFDLSVFGNLAGCAEMARRFRRRAGDNPRA
jgi:ATP-dependent Clp protease protease subunit